MAQAVPSAHQLDACALVHSVRKQLLGKVTGICVFYDPASPSTYISLQDWVKLMVKFRASES